MFRWVYSIICLFKVIWHWYYTHTSGFLSTNTFILSIKMIKCATMSRKCWWWNCRLLFSGSSQYTSTGTVIYMSPSASIHPHFLFSRLKVEAIVWKMVPCQSSAMSKLRCHVDSPILWMQIKREIKKVIKTLLTSDNCLSQEAFSFQHPVY